jgi:hypothetical protein
VAFSSANRELLLRSPFPQLLPYLDECLNLSGAGKSVVDETAILEGALVELPYSLWAKVRQALAKFLELFVIQSVGGFANGPPGHDKRC